MIEMTDDAEIPEPTVNLTYRTVALTPRGTAVVQLIRAGWLRDVAPNDREPAIYGVCIAVPGLTPADRTYLTDLVAAHQK